MQRNIMALEELDIIREDSQEEEDGDAKAKKGKSKRQIRLNPL